MADIGLQRVMVCILERTSDSANALKVVSS
jgi:hypothetical protein